MAALLNGTTHSLLPIMPVQYTEWDNIKADGCFAYTAI